MPGRFTGPALWTLVIMHARCSDSGLDPDQWFPVSADPGQARQEAAAAITICTTCPVRGHCLTLSLHHWDIGQHAASPLTVHDWDSVIAQPEPAIVGLAAAVWPAAGAPGEAATVAQSQEFIASYQLSAGRQWTGREVQDAWAAGPGSPR